MKPHQCVSTLQWYWLVASVRLNVTFPINSSSSLGSLIYINPSPCLGMSCRYHTHAFALWPMSEYQQIDAAESQSPRISRTPLCKGGSQPHPLGVCDWPEVTAQAAQPEGRRLQKHSPDLPDSPVSRELSLLCCSWASHATMSFVIHPQIFFQWKEVLFNKYTLTRDSNWGNIWGTKRYSWAKSAQRWWLLPTLVWLSSGLACPLWCVSIVVSGRLWQSRVKTLPSYAGGAGSIPGRGAGIPHASWTKT